MYKKGFTIYAGIAIATVILVVAGVIFYNIQPEEEKMMEEGEAIVSEGKGLMEKGEAMIEEGEDMMKESEEMLNEAVSVSGVTEEGGGGVQIGVHGGGAVMQ